MEENMEKKTEKKLLLEWLYAYFWGSQPFWIHYENNTKITYKQWAYDKIKGRIEND